MPSRSSKKRSRPHSPADSGAGNPIKQEPGNSLASLAALVVLATVPFALSIGGELVFDDRKTVVENGVVRGTKPLIEVCSLIIGSCSLIFDL